MQNLGNNPELGISIGNGHKDTKERVALEGRIVQPPQERLEYLESVKGDVKSSILPKSFYQIVECRFNDQAWQVANIHEIPDLKRLLTYPTGDGPQIH